MDATKPEAWIRQPEAWIPKLGLRGGGCDKEGVEAARRLGFGNNRWICVVNFAIQNELQRFLCTFLQVNFSFGHNELENILFLHIK